MACTSSEQDPTQFESELSNVMYLLDELENGKLSPNFGDGRYKGVYNTRITQQRLDEKTEELCSSLKKLTPVKIKKKSLELQTWWRDHQAADKKRLADERAVKRNAKLAKTAEAKLTTKERKALGLK